MTFFDLDDLHRYWDKVPPPGVALKQILGAVMAAAGMEFRDAPATTKRKRKPSSPEEIRAFAMAANRGPT